MVTKINHDVAGVLEHALICHENHPDTFEECIRENLIMRYGTIPVDEAIGSVSKVINDESSLSGTQRNLLWQDYVASLNRKGLIDTALAEHLLELRKWE